MLRSTTAAPTWLRSSRLKGLLIQGHDMCLMRFQSHKEFYSSNSSKNNHPIDFTAPPFNPEVLNARIHKYILDNPDPISSTILVDALSACNKLASNDSTDDSSSSNFDTSSTAKLLQKVLQADKVQLSPSIVKEFLLSSPVPSTNAAINVIKAYQTKNKRDSLPLSTGLIPFRRAVYNADFDKAFELIDVTAASPAHLASVRRTWKKYGLMCGLGAGAILTSVEGLLRSGLVGTWEATGYIHAMVLTYLSSMTILSILAFAGKVSGSGEILKWIPGTMTNYWYLHANEMKMASLLADLNRSIPANQNECSSDVKMDLKKRKMQTIEFDQESMMKEYWARGGDGFEWIEPDQDPAEIMWRSRVQDKFDKERISSSYSNYENQQWADEVITHSLPHASLVDKPKSLPE